MENQSVNEKIEELKQKLALLGTFNLFGYLRQKVLNYWENFQFCVKLYEIDGDRKAFHENAEWTKRKNQEKIEQLRKENKDLRFKLQDLLEVSSHAQIYPHFWSKDFKPIFCSILNK